MPRGVGCEKFPSGNLLVAESLSHRIEISMPSAYNISIRKLTLFFIMGLFQKKNKKPEITPKDVLKHISALEMKLEETTTELQTLRKDMQKAITRIGITRFNPFREIGGDQSFSIALLDANSDGVVITSYYGREMNRVYAKGVQNGKSDHELSEEERNAIKHAIDGTIEQSEILKKEKDSTDAINPKSETSPKS